MSDEKAEYTRLPDGTFSVETCMGTTVFADATPAPALLSAERLAEIRAVVEEEHETGFGFWAQAAHDLLAHAAALTAQLQSGSLTERYPTVWAYEQACAALESHRSRAAEAEAQVAMLNVELAHAAESAEIVRRGCMLDAAANATEAARELSYEQQMRQQTEQAMIGLAAQVAGLKGELGEQEVEKFELMKDYVALLTRCVAFDQVLAEARVMAFTNYGAAYEHINAFPGGIVAPSPAAGEEGGQGA